MTSTGDVDAQVLGRALRAALDFLLRVGVDRAGRIVYEYDPIEDRARHANVPVREIGTAWDLAVLTDALGHRGLDERMQAWSDRFCRMLHSWHLPHADAAHLRESELREPPSVAHSAFLLLFLLAFRGRQGRPGEADAAARAVAEGILAQQRGNGSLKIHFDPALPDDGWELYAGEALLALASAGRAWRDARLLEAVARAFAFYRLTPPTGGYLAFASNWTCQAAAALYFAAADLDRRDLAGPACSIVADLQRRLLDSHFWWHVERSPERQAVVEVACGAEGLADAFAVARHRSGAGDAGAARAARSYAQALAIASRFLLDAQRPSGRGAGGFPHSRTNPLQRLDVTGHAASALLKIAALQLGERSPAGAALIMIMVT